MIMVYTWTNGFQSINNRDFYAFFSQESNIMLQKTTIRDDLKLIFGKCFDYVSPQKWPNRLTGIRHSYVP